MIIVDFDYHIEELKMLKDFIRQERKTLLEEMLDYIDKNYIQYCIAFPSSRPGEEYKQ